MATKRGHVHVLQFLYDHDCRGDEQTTATAAQEGKLEALQFLRSRGCPWADTIYCDAAESGSVPLVRWLVEQGIELNAATLVCAAKYGHLQLCQYLRAEGCAWDASATAVACKYSQVATLQWLIEQGCPYQIRTCCYFAAVYGHIAILVYMQSLGWLDAPVLLEALQVAGTFDQLAAAQWLRQQGAEWPTLLRFNVEPWSDALVAWARAEGCTSPTSTE
eukprot:3413-Heterococcus_DN1.PRE.1